MYFTSSPCHSTSSLSKYDSFPTKEDENTISPISRLNFKENGISSCTKDLSVYKVVNATVFTETTNTNTRGPLTTEAGITNGPVITCTETLDQFNNTSSSEKSFSQLLKRCHADLDGPSKQNLRFAQQDNSKHQKSSKGATQGSKLSKKDLLRIRTNVSKLGNQAMRILENTGFGNSKDVEHEVVLDFCAQSVSQMLKRMS